MIRLTLPYPVSANRYWRSRVVGRGPHAHVSTYVSTEAKAYREECAWRARLAGVREPFAGRVHLTLLLYPHRPLDWQRRQRKDPELWDDTVQCIDLGNAEKVLSDALNGVVWKDDKQQRIITKARMEPDEGGARVEIGIEELVPNRLQAVFPWLACEAKDGDLVRDADGVTHRLVAAQRDLALG